jgi:hypothetical protein
VRRKELNVLVQFATVDLVLDPVVREVHLAAEVRQVVVAGPVSDLVFATVGPPVAIRPSAVVGLEELLVLALEVLLEHHAAHVEFAVLLAEPLLLLTVRRVQLRVVH